MCLIKCGDLAKMTEDVELLSSNKKTRSTNIRKLLKNNFLSEHKYLALKKEGLSDKQIVEEIKEESGKVGLQEIFESIIKSGKTRTDRILDL